MNRLRVNLLLPLLVSALLLAACGAQSTDSNESLRPETAGEEEAPPDSTAGEDPLPELSERTSFAGFSFSIAHPSGWLVATDDPVTIINELAEDHETALQDERPPAIGYGVALDHRDMVFMRGLGLPEEPTLQDLFELNSGFFEWTNSLQATETEVFDAPALAIKAQEGENWTQTLMGFANEEAFLLSLTAPTEEALDAFLPTWEKMLQSIEPDA